VQAHMVADMSADMVADIWADMVRRDDMVRRNDMVRRDAMVRRNDMVRRCSKPPFLCLLPGIDAALPIFEQKMLSRSARMVRGLRTDTHALYAILHATLHASLCATLYAILHATLHASLCATLSANLHASLCASLCATLYASRASSSLFSCTPATQLHAYDLAARAIVLHAGPGVPTALLGSIQWTA
jgi:hypothetical protein